MLVIHAALAWEFRFAPAAVRRVKPGDRKHVRDVDKHLALIGELLHEHHAGEDEILWPVLRPRLSAAERRLLDNVETQHAGINSGLERVNDARRRWLEQPGHNHGEALANELQTLHGLVAEHLEDEEREVLPLAAAYLSEPEWHAIMEAGTLSRKMMLFAGMCCYRGDPEVLALMFRVLPAPIRRVFPLIARRMYARRAARVHGTTKP
jgi:hemerythrin-like domain-containing protein